MKVNLRLYLMMGLVSFFALGMSGCEEELKEYDNPSVTLEAGGGTTETTASFTVTPENAELCKYLYAEKAAGVTELPTTEVLTKGTDIAANAATTVELTGLTPGKTYTVTVLARKSGTISLVKSLDLTTRALPTATAVLDAAQSTRTSLTFTITPVDATKVAYILKEKAAPAPTLDDVLASGTEVSATEPTTVTEDGLTVDTEYLLYLAAERGQWKSDLKVLDLKTNAYTELLTMTLIEADAYGYHILPADNGAFLHVGLETWLVEFAMALLEGTEMEVLELFGFEGTGEQDIVWKNGEIDEGGDPIEVLPVSEYTVLAADTKSTKVARADFTTPTPDPSPYEITIEIPQDGITATKARILVTPAPEIPVYYELVALKAEYDEILAEEGLTSIQSIVLSQGDKMEEPDDYVWEGFDPETEYIMLVLGVDNDGNWAWATETFTTLVSTLPAPTVDLQLSLSRENGLTSYSNIVMDIKATNTAAGYYLLAETDLIDEMMTQEGLSYEEFCVKYGDEWDEEMVTDANTAAGYNTYFVNLEPVTSYTAIVVADNGEGKSAETHQSLSTEAFYYPDPVTSTLFDELPGNWTASITDKDGVTATFDVEIAAKAAEGVTDDYRQMNRLVCKGFTGAEYTAPGTEDELLTYGPKWFLEIADGDVVTVPANSQIPLYYDSSVANYLLGCTIEGNLFTAGKSFPVTVSEDGNTITVEPYTANGKTFYPSVLYQEGTSWYISLWGNSSITLTRNAPAGTRLHVAGRAPRVKAGIAKSAFRNEDRIGERNIPVWTGIVPSKNAKAYAPRTVSPFRFSQVNLRNPKAAKLIKAIEKHAAENPTFQTTIRKR